MSPRRCSLWCALALSVSACAHTAPADGVAVPPTGHVIAAPDSGGSLDPAGLTHLLRGLYFLRAGHIGAAIPHLRLALVYDRRSAFIHERLSRAWEAVGRRDKARPVLESGLELQPDDPWLNWMAGELAISDRRFSEAVEYLGKAVGADETLPKAGPLFVSALLWVERTEAARAAATRFSERLPSNADLPLGLGTRFEDHGLLKEALASYRAARQRRPADRMAAFGEVRVLSLLGQHAEAARALVPLVGFFPDEPELFVQVARLMFRAGLEDAVAYRREALRQTEGDAHGRTIVAAGEMLEGRAEEGVALLKETLAEAPSSLDARLYLAQVLLERHDTVGCLELLSGADAQNEVFLRPRAWCLAGAGRLVEAGEQLAAALPRSVRPADVVLDGARLFASTASQQRASALLQELLESAGDRIWDQDRLVARSILADSFGQGARAIGLLEQVARGQRRQDADLTLRLCDLRARYGRLPEALEELERLLSEDPDSPERLNALGYTLAQASVRLKEAEVWLRRAYRMAPDDAYIADSLGWVLYRRGEMAGALALLRRARLAAPGDAEILRHLGVVLRDSGDRVASRRVFEEALRSFPSPVLREQLRRHLEGGGES